jgi:hypothetical protein
MGRKGKKRKNGSTSSIESSSSPRAPVMASSSSQPAMTESSTGQLINQSANILYGTPPQHQAFAFSQQQVHPSQQLQQPIFSPQPVFQPSDSAMAHISARLDSITSKLSSLGAIESTMTQIRTQLELVNGKVERVQTELKSEMSNLRSSLRDIEQGVQSNSVSVESLSEKCTGLRTDQDYLYESLLELQTRSMRDNLLFFGLPEVEGSDEDCVKTIHQFCKDKLNMADAETTIKLDRAHRIGRRGPRPRPVVAKFNFFPVREEVRRSSYKLKDTTYGISEQFPREIQERRKQLLPVLHQAKRDGKRANLVVDRLYIDGRPYIPQNRK